EAETGFPSGIAEKQRLRAPSNGGPAPRLAAPDRGFRGARFQGTQRQLRQRGKMAAGAGVEFARLDIGDAEGTDTMAVRQDQRVARIEPEARGTLDLRVVGEAVVQ